MLDDRIAERRSRSSAPSWAGAVARALMAEPGMRRSGRHLLHVYAVALILSCWLGRGVLADVPATTSPTGWCYVAAAYLSSMVLLNALALAASLGLAWLVDRWWMTLIGSGLLFLAVQGFVFADVIIYRLYGYHINGMILNMLITPGAGDSLDMGAGTRLSAVLASCGIVAALFGPAAAFAWRDLRRAADGPGTRREPPSPSPGPVALARSAAHRLMTTPGALRDGGPALGVLLLTCLVVRGDTVGAGEAVVAALLAVPLALAVLAAVARGWALVVALPLLFLPLEILLLEHVGPLDLAWSAYRDGILPAGYEALLEVGRTLLAHPALLLVPVLQGATFAAWLWWRPDPREDPAPRRAPRWSGRRRRLPRVAWRALVMALALLPVLVLVDKALFAWGEATDRTEITRVQDLFGPLYQPLQARDQDAGHRHEPLRALGRRGGHLDYPHEPLSFAPDAQRPNIVILALEGARFDAYDPEVMPRLHAFGEEHVVARRHYSGGNSSRYGVFSLLYGLYGTAWEAALSARRGPALIEAVADLGYDLRILACSDLNFPEFRKTCFVDVPPERIVDRWRDEEIGGRHMRDAVVTDRLVERIRSGGTDPLFAFIFYDASHFPYTYPDEHAVHEPAIDPGDIDMIALARTRHPDVVAALRNRYRNSLHYLDHQIGRIIDALAETGELERTLLFVVGDHGEEFCELGTGAGHLIHNGNFGAYQTRTVMVAHVPGVGRRRIDHVTSHADVAPTILQALGCRNPVGDHSVGRPLDGPAADRRWVVITGWDEGAMTDGEILLRFGRVPAKRHVLARHEAETYRLVAEGSAALEDIGSAWRAAVGDAGRFIRP